MSTLTHSTNNHDEQLLLGRFMDLSNICYNRNIPVFSAFLNLNEQALYESLRSKMPPIFTCTLGGYELAERKLAVFLPEENYFYDTPFTIVKIAQKDKRFSSDLTHRDFLGALMNLGIERALLGDIVLFDNTAYVFCLTKIAQYITDNLTRVRNDFVLCTIVDNLPSDFSPSYKEISGSVASLRLDALISLAFNESRSHSVGFIENALVFVNGKMITSNAYQIKDNDIISVRRKGRFKFTGIRNETKKGRFFVTLQKFE